jgi:methyl-accepting chemotaxis protein
MSGEANEHDAPARLGLRLVLAVGLWTLLLLLVAEGRGGAGWPFGAFLLLAVGVLFGYHRWVYGPQLRLAAASAGMDRVLREHEGALVESLDRLRAGDLVHCAERADTLPGEIGRALTQATNSLDVLAQQIQSSSLAIALAAGSVDATAAELASGSAEQASSVVEITTTMVQLARTASQIAANAATQAELAGRAQADGHSGQGAVAEAVGGIEEVRKRIQGIAGRAEILGNRSKEIYRVLDLTTEISQETHILSLNAAIEAAAAGEHGRRFSVVAEEVRRLAQRSQESVESVRTLLDEFAGSIRGTVVATEEGIQEASGVLARARAAAVAIQELRAASSEAAAVAREISLATQQQNSASDQVVLTLKEVSRVVQRTADGLKQFSATADRLNHLALDAQMLAQSFHLDSPHSLKHTAAEWGRLIERRTGNWEAIERLIEGLAERHPYVECVYVFDGQMQQLAIAVNRKMHGDREIPLAVRSAEGFLERPWYRAAMTERHAVLTSPYTSLLSGQSILTAAVAVADGQGGVAGILGLDVNVDSWTKI